MTNSIEVEIGGKKFEVKKFTVEMDIRRALLQSLILSNIRGEEITAQPMLRIASTVYIPLASCTFPVDKNDTVPSLSEFLDMDGIEADEWRKSVQTINPTWFYENEKITKELEKKKDKKLTRSIPSS